MPFFGQNISTFNVHFKNLWTSVCAENLSFSLLFIFQKFLLVGCMPKHTQRRSRRRYAARASNNLLVCCTIAAKEKEEDRFGYKWDACVSVCVLNSKFIIALFLPLILVCMHAYVYMHLCVLN